MSEESPVAGTPPPPPDQMSESDRSALPSPLRQSGRRGLALTVRLIVGGWKLWLGSLLSTFFLLSFLVAGWATRAAQREALKTWWRRSPARTRGGTFGEFAVADPLTSEHRTWPHWILGPSPARPLGVGERGILHRALGGMLQNARLGIQMAFNTAVLTLPGCLLWAVAWFAGWQNSFNKGYEHAWFGPSVFILGMLLFTAAMAYVPWAQARQASTGDWRRFYDFRLVWRLVRRHWLASVGLSLAWAGAMGVVLLVKLGPALAQYVPKLAEASAEKALEVSQRYYGLMALGLFPLFVALRLLAARFYARALGAAAQAGSVTEDDLGEYEWHALRRLEMLTPRPSTEPRRWLRLARWLATRTGQLSAAAAVFAVWFALSFLIVVSEFIGKTEWGRGWWNQPMIQLPWFDYTPQRLREAARAGAPAAESAEGAGGLAPTPALEFAPEVKPER